MAIEVKPDNKNAQVLMLVNWELEPNVTDVKPEQLSNAALPMDVTPSGMAIEVKLVALLNA